MRQRGRKPASARPVVIQGGFARRPEPPAELTARQTAIWSEVVAGEDPAFFATGATRGLLADYCRRRESSETISAIIDTFKPEWLKSSDGAERYNQLLRMRDIECRGAASLAGKLRLTNSARYTPQSAATAARNALASVAKPWEL